MTKRDYKNLLIGQTVVFRSNGRTCVMKIDTDETNYKYKCVVLYDERVRGYTPALTPGTRVDLTVSHCGYLEFIE